MISYLEGVSLSSDSSEIMHVDPLSLNQLTLDHDRIPAGIVTRRPLVLQLINRPATAKPATASAGETDPSASDIKPLVPGQDTNQNPDEWGEFLHREYPYITLFLGYHMPSPSSHLPHIPDSLVSIWGPLLDKFRGKSSLISIRSGKRS